MPITTRRSRREGGLPGTGRAPTDVGPASGLQRRPCLRLSSAIRDDSLRMSGAGGRRQEAAKPRSEPEIDPI